jgi:phage shock protein E
MKGIHFLALVLTTIAGLAGPTFGVDATPLLLIDVRTQAEWNKGHLKGAILIPYDRIREKIGNVVINKSQRIYLYCRTGRRSQIAKETLNKMGYKDVVNLGSLEDASRIMKIRIVK